MPVSLGAHVERHYLVAKVLGGKLVQKLILTGVNLDGLWAGHLALGQRLSVYVGGKHCGCN